MDMLCRITFLELLHPPIVAATQLIVFEHEFVGGVSTSTVTFNVELAIDFGVRSQIQLSFDWSCSVRCNLNHLRLCWNDMMPLSPFTGLTMETDFGDRAERKDIRHSLL